MILPKLVLLFMKTTASGFGLIGRSDKSKNHTKQRWGEMVLKDLGFEIEVQGHCARLENCIIVGNHISYLDIPVLLSVVPEARFIAKDDLKKWPMIGAVATFAGTIFVSRGAGSDRTAAKEMIERQLLNRGVKMVVFPSGTTTLTENRPWKKGIFEIARKTRTPIQLVRIDYEPLRPAAYIDEDNLVHQISGLFGIKNKKVTVRWLECFTEIQEPELFGESLRRKVATQQKEVST